MSEATFTLVASVIIDRPVDVVTHHFHDLDHVVRDHLYQNMSLRWLAPKVAGERRLLQEVRVLGVTYRDELVAEAGEDGSLLLRYVSGPNKGARLHESFQAEGDDKTRATIVARVPAGGFKWATGPLFKLTVRKMLERTLTDHKQDLEKGYEPGRARGNIKAALEPLAPVIERARALATDAERVAMMAPIVEAACVTAIADNDVDDAERDAIHAVIRTLGMQTLDDDAVEAVIASSIDRTREQGIEPRCDELGQRLRVMDLALPGLSVATLVAQISHGVDQPELAALQRIARAAGVSDEGLAELIERVDARLSVPT
jgi:tellurite resistance protein